MSTRPCPYCGEEVQAAAVKCRFCKEALGGDGGAEPAAPQKKGGASTAVIVIVVVALLCVVGVPVLSIIAAIAIPNLIEARKSGNEAAAIGALKTLSTAQTIFAQGDKDGDQLADFGTLAELGKTGLVDPILGNGTKQGYMFEVTVGAGEGSAPACWAATADPLVPQTTGDRWFGTDERGVIYDSLTAPFYTSMGALESPSDARPLGKQIGLRSVGPARPGP